MGVGQHVLTRNHPREADSIGNRGQSTYLDRKALRAPALGAWRAGSVWNMPGVFHVMARGNRYSLLQKRQCCSAIRVSQHILTNRL